MTEPLKEITVIERAMAGRLAELERNVGSVGGQVIEQLQRADTAMAQLYAALMDGNHLVAADIVNKSRRDTVQASLKLQQLLIQCGEMAALGFATTQQQIEPPLDL